jgi:hypothetical protein
VSDHERKVLLDAEAILERLAHTCSPSQIKVVIIAAASIDNVLQEVAVESQVAAPY